MKPKIEVEVTFIVKCNMIKNEECDCDYFMETSDKDFGCRYKESEHCKSPKLLDFVENKFNHSDHENNKSEN